MRLFTACLLGLLAAPAAAEIYRYTDAQGRTVFSDRPPQGQPAQRVEPSPLTPIAPPAPSTPAERPALPTTQRYARLEITNLPDDEALRANNGTFDVEVAVEPPLFRGHSLRLLLDGNPHGPATQGTPLTVRQADRGTHSLVVQVLDARGRPIQQSDALTFTVQRISVNSPARPAPPRPTPNRPAP